ncbi:MAG: hypothetical protein PHP01_03475 [Phycisphaerae bacterium]|nr:hypothetical protein [Phycisphaerae bacterium]
MKKLFFLFIATGLLYALAGCQEKNLKDSDKTVAQADFKFSCVAKFLRLDGSWYLTEQGCELFFEPAAMKITADEPSGQIIWLVDNGQVTVKTRPKNVYDKDILDLMTDDAICRALLGLYLAELKNMKSDSGTGQSFTFEGQVYDFVCSAGNGINLYKKGSVGKTDLAVAQGKKKYVLNAYNYLKLDKDGYFPTKIDIYACDTDREKRLIAQYICQVD